VPIDVRITLLMCLSAFSICIFISLIPAYVCLHMYTHNPADIFRFLYCYTYTHLPPTSRTLMLASKYTYISQYILLPLLYEPVVPLCFLLRVCVRMYMCTYVCTCILMNSLYPVCFCVGCVFLIFLPGCISVFGALRLVCSIPYS